MRIVRDGELHGDLLAVLVSRLGVGRYLELGIAFSETLVKVWNTAREQVEIHAVDVKAPEVMLPGVRYYVGTTRSYLTEVAPAHGLRFDLAFIDADHAADSVREDLINLLPLMNEHGLIALHDTFPATQEDCVAGLCGDAWKVAAGLSVAYPGLEAVTLPYSPGLTLARMRTRHLAW